MAFSGGKQMNKTRWLVGAGLILILSTGVSSAVTRVQKLSENRYLVTLKKLSGFGGEGKVLRRLNHMVASLCVIAGYEWYEVLDRSSHGRGFVKTAAGTVEVKFHHEQGNDDMNNCKSLATEKEKTKMTKSLKKAGIELDPAAGEKIAKEN